MQPSAPTFPRLSSLWRLASIVAVGCALAACDRHSAEEVPESYGHGSGQRRSYENHKTDSQMGTHHFSDTTGTDTEESHTERGGHPTASPAGTPAGHLF